MLHASTTELPLAGVRILDLCVSKGEVIGRFLGDLGADILLLDTRTPDAAGSDRSDQAATRDAMKHANKRVAHLDLETEAGRRRLRELASTADIVLECFAPGYLAERGLGADDLLGVNEQLVILSFTDFGQTGPYRDWAASNATHLAMAGMLSRSGLPERAPLLPPGDLAYESAGIQAAWCVLLAYLNAFASGRGDHLDFSVFEATAQILDPGLGVTGSAATGASAMVSTHGRPDVQFMYPILACGVGHVRLCVLSPRQWHGLRRWLGEPAEFAGSGYDAMLARFAAWPQISEHVRRRLSTLTAAEAVEQLQQHGVPTGAVATPADVLTDQHFQERSAFSALHTASGAGLLASGFVEIDGARPRVPQPPVVEPALRAEEASPAAPWDRRDLRGSRSPFGGHARRSPLAGLRVLDLGVIVAGAETGRLFADHGADVIKIENTTFPDGGRQTAPGEVMSASTALGHRGKRSFGLDLRSAEGKQIFFRLVAQADIVLSNFKPGTMDSLGLSHEVLSSVNPRIISVDSSAFGPTGPLARSMGYGPIVRAATGLTWSWRYAEVEDSFSDAVTIFPDHLAARVAAAAALSLVVRRMRTGRGGTVSVAQAEVILNIFAEHFFNESLRPGAFGTLEMTRSSGAPFGVFPCAGDDEWCVIDVRDDREFAGLVRALGSSELQGGSDFATAASRLVHRARLTEIVSALTATMTPDEVTAALQAENVPVAPMRRLPQLLDDPHLAARRFAVELHQPQFPEPLATENGPCLSRRIADPVIRSAPMSGEHTREIARELLELDDAELEQLLAAGVLEEYRDTAGHGFDSLSTGIRTAPVPAGISAAAPNESETRR